MTPLTGPGRCGPRIARSRFASSRSRAEGSPTPGNAGLLEARFEFVSFVDDDNWVCPDWVHIVHDVLSSDPQLGACGGPSEGVF